MTRLRYKKIVNTSLLVSKADILCNNKNVNVVIDEATLVYKLYEVTSVLVQGQGLTLSDCKKRVKNDLKVLGATFFQEIRNRGATAKL